MKRLLLVLLLVGCEKEPLSKSSTANPNFEVEKLFTYDGVTVYRFQDSGGNKYFTSLGETRWSVKCGKSCTRDESMPAGMMQKFIPIKK